MKIQGKNRWTQTHKSLIMISSSRLYDPEEYGHKLKFVVIEVGW